MVCLSVILFGTQKSRDYINRTAGTRGEACEGPTSVIAKIEKFSVGVCVHFPVFRHIFDT